MIVEVFEEPEKFAVCPILNWNYKYTVTVIIVDYKYIIVSPFGGYWELSSEVCHNLLLLINDIGEYLIGVMCYTIFDWSLVAWWN